MFLCETVSVIKQQSKVNMRVPAPGARPAAAGQDSVPQPRPPAATAAAVESWLKGFKLFSTLRMSNKKNRFWNCFSKMIWWGWLTLPRPPVVKSQTRFLLEVINALRRLRCRVQPSIMWPFLLNQLSLNNGLFIVYIQLYQHQTYEGKEKYNLAILISSWNCDFIIFILYPTVANKNHTRKSIYCRGGKI